MPTVVRSIDTSFGGFLSESAFKGYDYEEIHGIRTCTTIMSQNRT
jgi:hypothetical protein